MLLSDGVCAVCTCIGEPDPDAELALGIPCNMLPASKGRVQISQLYICRGTHVNR